MHAVASLPASLPLLLLTLAFANLPNTVRGTGE